MTDWATAADDYQRELAQRTAARAPATMLEILGSGWTGAGLQTIPGLAHYTNAALDDLEAAVAGATGGQTIAQFTGVTTAFGDRSPQLEALQNSLGKFPEKTRIAIAPLIDVRARAAEKAQADEAKAADAAGGIYNLGGQALSFAANAARQAVDPVSIASLPIGGPLKGPILGVLAREAAIGAAVVGLQQPAITAQRAQLDLSEADNPLATVLAAGIGSAAFAGLFRLGAAAYRAAVPAPAVGEQVGRAAGAAMLNVAGGELAGTAEQEAADILFRPRAQLDPRVSADDLAAAANLAERDQIMDAGAVPRTPAGRAATAEKIDAAAAAIEQGKAARSGEQPVPRAAATTELPFGPEMPAPATTVPLSRIQTRLNDVETLILPGGRRLVTRPAVVELGELVVSHSLDGVPNPSYPAELQPRAREAGASRTFIAERARTLEPELLGHSVTPQEGAPIVGPDMVVESGNGRAMMIARAYDRHPERAAAYRQFLQSQGYDVSGFKFPVLVRIRESDVADRAAFAREANVSTVAGLSAREQAFADAKGLSDDMLAMWAPGETGSAANVRFVRAFAERIVAPEERPQFVGAGDRLSAAGARRVEAAMVARAWGATDVVSALYEDVTPTSRAILGAMADTAPETARLKVAIADGRVPPEADPTPALLDAFRLVERARHTNQKVANLVAQIDIEHGAVAPEVAEATRLYFREDDYTVSASRDVVAARINKAVMRALDSQNAVGDLFGVSLDVGGNLRAAKLAGETLDEQPIDPAIAGPQPKPEAQPAAAPGGKERISVSDLIAESQPAGTNAAGQPLYDNPRGRFRVRTDRKAQPEGYADFGGDLAPVEGKAAAQPAAAAPEAAPPVKGTSPASNLGPNGTPYAPAPGLAAQAEAALADAGGDLRIFIEPSPGVFVQGSARDLLKQADDYESAAAELAACIASEAAE